MFNEMHDAGYEVTDPVGRAFDRTETDSSAGNIRIQNLGYLNVVMFQAGSTGGGISRPVGIYLAYFDPVIQPPSSINEGRP